MTTKYDHTDPDQVVKRAETHALARQQAAADWQYVLNAPQGRRVMAALLTHTGFLGSSYRSGDALGTAYAEGMRAVGLLIHTAATSAGQAGLAEALLAEVMRKSNG